MPVMSLLVISRWLAAIFVASLSLSPAIAQTTETRLALVIGNSNYLHVAKLSNPANDARLLERTLHGVGFAVTTVIDADRRAMWEAVRTFSGRVKNALNPVVVVFFAGQGIAVDGRNLLMPTDVRLAKPEHAQDEAVILDEIIGHLEAANPASLNFLFIDACRDNPFAKPQNSRTIGERGLAPVAIAGDRTVIMFSTGPGAVALDGSGANSPFAEALATQIPTPGLEWSDFYRRVQNDVITAAGGQQKPQMYGLPTRQFYFVQAALPVGPALPSGSDPVTRAARIVVEDKKAPGKFSYAYDDSYALLIGVSTYKNAKAWPPLPGATRDVKALSKVLNEVHGFKVTTVPDPDSEQLLQAVKEFVKVNGRKENARLIIYFAGHGYTTERADARKIGWFVPADAPIQRMLPRNSR